jgi:type I restriction enzyme M protein
MNTAEQEFLKALDDKLWKAADKLRNNLDAANYKHVVLGLIFLKYVSDAFEERQLELRSLFTVDEPDSNGEDNIYYMPRDDYDSDAAYEEAVNTELELHEYYQEKNVFWVPHRSRWNTLKQAAALPIGSVIWQDANGDDVKLRSISWLIDQALEQIESFKIDDKLVNPKLKGILSRVGQYQVDNHNLSELINRFSDTSFSRPEYNGQALSLHSKDILGHVYEYFLGQFALAEGKQGGQYYTPKSIVTLIIEMLAPYTGRVYDPAMGAGGFFVSNDKFLEAHAAEKHYDPAEQKKRISVYGQESNPTTWKLAAMNMAIRGIDFNFGKKNADSFLDDQHPDLRADYVMANPPFNIKEWWHAKLEGDVRWKYGTPPQGNANFGWIQHMLHHLNDQGSMALLLANGSMSSNTNNEGEIRKALIENDLVECMVALPGQLFTNTQIPACIWFLTKDKANGLSLDKKKTDRRGKTLFIDARNLGYMKDRVLRDFEPNDIAKIADTFHAWQQDDGNAQGSASVAGDRKPGATYEDEKGFCYSASLDDMKKHEFVLTPGRYVGAADQEEDSEPFAEKMARLTTQLKSQFAESDRLEGEIRNNLAGLGYEF